MKAADTRPASRTASKIVLAIGAVLLVLVMLARSGGSSDPGKLTYVYSRLEMDESGRFGQIEGEVWNESDHTYTYAEVRFKLWDASGRFLGTAFANTDHLPPRAKWRFTAPVSEDGVSLHEFEGVEGW